MEESLHVAVFELFVFASFAGGLCPYFDSCAVFLLGVRGHSRPRGPAELPAAAERHSQADLHLQLPQLCRLAPQRPPELRAGAAIQRRQRRGADARKHAIHQRAVRRLPGKRRAFAAACRAVLQAAACVCFSAVVTLRPGEDGAGVRRPAVQHAAHTRCRRV